MFRYYTWTEHNSFLSFVQAQHISSGVHRSTGADLPTQHPWHKTAVSPLCYWTIIQRRHRWRRSGEQHPPHSIHHPHCALRPQHVSSFSPSICILLQLCFWAWFHFPVTSVQGLRLGRRRTCRVSRSSHVTSGWRARTRSKDRTTTLSWPCTSCLPNAGGVHAFTSYEDFWSPHMPARFQPSLQTSMLHFLDLHLFSTDQ